jgi:hypothetical protein
METSTAAGVGPFSVSTPSVKPDALTAIPIDQTPPSAQDWCAVASGIIPSLPPSPYRRDSAGSSPTQTGIDVPPCVYPRRGAYFRPCRDRSIYSKTYKFLICVILFIWIRAAGCPQGRSLPRPEWAKVAERVFTGAWRAPG